ncbi:hypothetical protein MMC19_000959 [Ptychographa xylographoides]|nr:hypothetical protein [Ptychographa xylographoides]
MPPRKSNVSAISVTGDDANGTPTGKDKEKEKEKEKEKDGINMEDLSMPRTMVQRLAKGVLPPNTQIQKDAITAFSKSCTLFVSYLSHTAHAHTQKTNRKTISPADVFNALRDTEFEIFADRLDRELGRYNEVQTGKRNEYRKKVREGVMGVGGVGRRRGGNIGGLGRRVVEAEADEERLVKKARMDADGTVGVPAPDGGDGDGDGDETVDEEEGEADGEGGGGVGEDAEEEDEDADDDEGEGEGEANGEDGPARGRDDEEDVMRIDGDDDGEDATEDDSALDDDSD